MKMIRSCLRRAVRIDRPNRDHTRRGLLTDQRIARRVVLKRTRAAAECEHLQLARCAAELVDHDFDGLRLNDAGIRPCENLKRIAAAVLRQGMVARTLPIVLS